jgi:hypothetical protein
VDAAEPGGAGAQPLDVAQVARAERLGEAAGHRRGLGRAGPAVRVVHRGDRPVAEEAAASDDQEDHRNEEPRLQAGAAGSDGSTACGHARPTSAEAVGS